MKKIGELVKIKQVDGFKIQERTLTPEKNRGEGLGTHKINLVTGSTTFQNPRAKYEVCVSSRRCSIYTYQPPKKVYQRGSYQR